MQHLTKHENVSAVSGVCHYKDMKHSLDKLQRFNYLICIVESSYN